MAVIRVVKDSNFTILSNYHLRDKNLSLKAVGLLSLMLSLPEDWDYSVAGLTAIVKDGKAAVKSALVELEELGYLVRQQAHSEDGTFGDIEYVIYEKPPIAENRLAVKAHESQPIADYPPAEKPPAENRTQINKDIPSKDRTNTPKAPPRGRRVAKTIPDWDPQNFERFWALYPRGEDRAGAAREWDALRPDRELLQVMSHALKEQMRCEEWQRGIGIPYACRWLKNRRWTDTKLRTSTSEGWAPDPELE